MAAFDFPNNPAVGDRTTNVGITYIWDGQKWVNGTTSSSSIQTNCVVFTGPGLNPMYECLDSNSDIQISDANKTGRVWFTQQGLVGIGTATPITTLEVNGMVRITGDQPWPNGPAPCLRMNFSPTGTITGEIRCDDFQGTYYRLNQIGNPLNLNASAGSDFPINIGVVQSSPPKYKVFIGGEVSLMPFTPFNTTASQLRFQPPGGGPQVVSAMLSNNGSVFSVGLTAAGDNHGLARTPITMAIDLVTGYVGLGTPTPSSIVYAMDKDPTLTLMSNNQNPDSSYSNLVIAAVSNATTNPDFTAYADSALIMTKGGTQLNVTSSDIINLIPGAGGVYAVPITTGSGGSAFAIDFTTYNVGIGIDVPNYRLDISTGDRGPTLSTASQVHIAHNNADTGGGYLTSTMDNQFLMSAGTAWNGTGWIAKSAIAGIMGINPAGAIAFNTDSGLTVGNAYTPTNRMTIAATGNVGIGNNASVVPDTGTTSARLIVGSTTTGNANTGSIVITSSSSGWGTLAFANYDITATEKRLVTLIAIPTPTIDSGNLGFYTLNAGAFGERMRLTAAGQVGIGTSTPGDLLSIANPNAASYASVSVYNNLNHYLSLVSYGSGVGSGVNDVTTIESSTSIGIVVNGVTNPVRAMTIATSGYVGIGTTGPSAQLMVQGACQATTQPDTVYGSLGGTLYVSDTNGAANNGGMVLFGAVQGSFAAIKALVTNGGNYTTGDLMFCTRRNAAYTALSESLRVVSAGNILIWQASVDTTGCALQVSSGISNNGAIVAAPSDIRLKRDVEPFRDGLAAVRHVNPIRFRYNGKGGMKDGLPWVSIDAGAHASIIPDAINTFEGELDGENTQLYNFSQQPLVMALVNAVKELAARIEQLESTVPNYRRSNGHD